MQPNKDKEKIKQLLFRSPFTTKSILIKWIILLLICFSLMQAFFFYQLNYILPKELESVVSKVEQIDDSLNVLSKELSDYSIKQFFNLIEEVRYLNNKIRFFKTYSIFKNKQKKFHENEYILRQTQYKISLIIKKIGRIAVKLIKKNKLTFKNNLEHCNSIKELKDITSLYRNKLKVTKELINKIIRFRPDKKNYLDPALKRINFEFHFLSEIESSITNLNIKYQISKQFLNKAQNYFKEALSIFRQALDCTSLENIEEIEIDLSKAIRKLSRAKSAFLSPDESIKISAIRVLLRKKMMHIEDLINQLEKVEEFFYQDQGFFKTMVTFKAIKGGSKLIGGLFKSYNLPVDPTDIHQLCMAISKKKGFLKILDDMQAIEEDLSEIKNGYNF